MEIPVRRLRSAGRPLGGLAAAVALWVSLGAVLAAAGAGPVMGVEPLLDVEPSVAEVGQPVSVRGHGFAPGESLTLVWRTVRGQWRLGTDARGEWNGDFLGPAFTPAEEVLGRVTAGPDGTFQWSMVVPEDYGGVHEIAALGAGGQERTKAALRISPSVEYSPKEGPVGTPITVRVRGLNHPHWVEGWYQVLYDNRLTGYISGVTSRGTATFTIPATGGVGLHFIEIQNGPFGHPYRALETSPYSHLPTFRLPFRVTAGPPVLPPEPLQQLPKPLPASEPAGAGPAIWFDPAGGPVGLPITLRGKGFPAGAQVEIYRYGQSGSRVTESMYRAVREPMTRVTADASGRFGLPMALPDIHGGTHTVGAAVGGQEVATTRLQVYRTPVSLAPDGEAPSGGPVRVKAGTVLKLHVKGVGWTETENIFALVYDNAYIGYACGFSTNGDVVVYLMATGEPGWHFLDLYPTFYRNRDYAKAVEAPFLYRMALLSWQDHPHPFVLRYAFEIVE